MHFLKLFILFLILASLFFNSASASGTGRELANNVVIMAEKNLVLTRKSKEAAEKMDLLLAEITNEENSRKMSQEQSFMMQDCIIEVESIMDEIRKMFYFYELIKLCAIRGVSSNEYMLWYVNLKAEYSENVDFLKYLTTGESVLEQFLNNL